MWFQALSFVIAAALLVKATVALIIPGRFYATRRRQYDSTSMPPELLVPPLIIFSVTSVAWYATVFHYRPWGWIVTGAVTLLCSLSLHNLLRWRRHRQAMSNVVAHPHVWMIDCLLLVLGSGFAALGLWVYGN